MKAIEVYEGFIQFEERSADLYLELSVRFMDNPALRWFWVEMAMEEKQHAGMLQHCREAGLIAGDLPHQEQIQRIDNLYNKLEKRIVAPDLTLDGAFDIAIRLESSEINDVYGKLTAPIAGPDHILRKKLELSVETHFQKLYQAARTFGTSVDTQMRLSRLLASGRSPRDLA
jgi:hypothetical protein